MKRPIERGLTTFWLNGEIEACAHFNGHIVPSVAIAACTQRYGN